MIRYVLRCQQEHEFEAWFRDSSAYDEQVAAQEINCPFCGSVDIRKAIMAPNVASRKEALKRPESAPAEMPSSAAPSGAPMVAQPINSPEMAQALNQVYQALDQLRQSVEQNCEYVGQDFAEEARAIHYGETEARGIYGETSPDEAEDLMEEGIEFMRLPTFKPVASN